MTCAMSRRLVDRAHCDPSRRQWLGGSMAAMAGLFGVGVAMASPSMAASAPAPQRPTLTRPQSLAFQQWFVAIVSDQVLRPPSPRWVHRDCAGLVRFSVAEALRPHNPEWLKAMGWPLSQPRAPEVDLRPDQSALRQPWLASSGQASSFVSALALVQNNARFIGKGRTQAQPGDLLFYDQGDDQHLMVWTGRRVAYHNGSAPSASDTGLRWRRWDDLQASPDTRWRPEERNPNFVGLFRLAFLMT